MFSSSYANCFHFLAISLQINFIVTQLMDSQYQSQLIVQLNSLFCYRKILHRTESFQWKNTGSYMALWNCLEDILTTNGWTNSPTHVLERKLPTVCLVNIVLKINSHKRRSFLNENNNCNNRFFKMRRGLSNNKMKQQTPRHIKCALR